MLKPNPLHSISTMSWLAFKMFTVAFGEIGGMCLMVCGVLFLGTQIGFAMLVMGMLMFYGGKSLAQTLLEEDGKKPKKKDDDGPDLPFGTV